MRSDITKISSQLVWNYCPISPRNRPTTIDTSEMLISRNMSHTTLFSKSQYDGQTRPTWCYLEIKIYSLKIIFIFFCRHIGRMRNNLCVLVIFYLSKQKKEIYWKFISTANSIDVYFFSFLISRTNNSIRIKLDLLKTTFYLSTIYFC